MGVQVIPIPTEVVSHSLLFPFPILCFIPIPMGFPWDSRSHWESHSHTHLYSQAGHAQPFTKATNLPGEADWSRTTNCRTLLVKQRLVGYMFAAPPLCVKVQRLNHSTTYGRPQKKGTE